LDAAISADACDEEKRAACGNALALCGSGAGTVTT
jgi:hypothetical protein